MFYTSNKQHLSPGDVVEIIAPSSKCHSSVLDKVKALLHDWGLKCQIPEDIFGESLLYANSDEKRFSQLQSALLNKESKAIWCLLGGFGATKLIPQLGKTQPPDHAKIFIGFSDITALHIFLQGQWGWSTIHGPSGYQASLEKVSQNSIDILKNILFGRLAAVSYNPLQPLNALAQNHSEIEAHIIGGNLHIIQTSLGTPWQIQTQDKIVFIEDINERAYRIDRTLAHLSQAGVFDQVKAVLLGDFTDKGEPNGSFLVKDIVEAFAKECAQPVFKINDVGHGTVNNPILLGSMAKISIGRDCSLEFRLL